MSSRTDLNANPELDVDAILEEFYRQESEPANAPSPAVGTAIGRPSSPASVGPAVPDGPSSSVPSLRTPVSTAAMPVGEGTLLYEAKPAEETALYTGPVVSAPIKSPAKPKKKARRSVEKPLEPVPVFRSPDSVAQKKKTRSRGLGFALMFVALLLLAAALAGLLRWSSLAERESAAPEPAALRLELGQSLESLLDEHAGTSR